MASRMRRKIVDTIGVMVRSRPLKACISMTMGLCFHFIGYECARAASITLLAAKVRKFTGASFRPLPLLHLLSPPAGNWLRKRSDSTNDSIGKPTEWLGSVPIHEVYQEIRLKGYSPSLLPSVHSVHGAHHRVRAFYDGNQRQSRHCGILRVQGSVCEFAVQSAVGVHCGNAE